MSLITYVLPCISMVLRGHFCGKCSLERIILISLSRLMFVNRWTSEDKVQCNQYWIKFTAIVLRIFHLTEEKDWLICRTWCMRSLIKYFDLFIDKQIYCPITKVALRLSSNKQFPLVVYYIAVKNTDIEIWAFHRFVYGKKIFCTYVPKPLSLQNVLLASLTVVNLTQCVTSIFVW